VALLAAHRAPLDALAHALLGMTRWTGNKFES
jgi:hypothetical protein